MHTRLILKACLIVCRIAVVFLTVMGKPMVSAQTNFTVGDGYGTDYTAYLFAPYAWDIDLGEDEYRDHLCLAIDGSSGQGYDEMSYEDDYGPYPWHGLCTLDVFLTIISSQSDNLGTLLICSHGDANGFDVEVYDASAYGLEAWIDAANIYFETFDETEISLHLG